MFLFTSKKLFSATKLLFLFDLLRNSKECTFAEKLVKNFYPDFLPAHTKFYSENHNMGLHVVLGFQLLVTFIGTMDSQHYVEETLEIYLRPSIVVPLGDCIFQQDNAPPHTARITKQWLANNGIPVVNWPPYSPFLNPIEHVWGHLNRKLYTSMPSTQQEVMNTFLSLWNELRTQYAESSVFSIYSRMDNIIQTNGLRH